MDCEISSRTTDVELSCVLKVTMRLEAESLCELLFYSN